MNRLPNSHRIEAFIGGALIIIASDALPAFVYAIAKHKMGLASFSLVAVLAFPLGIGLFLGNAKAISITKYYLLIRFVLGMIAIILALLHTSGILTQAPDVSWDGLVQFLCIAGLLILFYFKKMSEPPMATKSDGVTN